MSAAPRQLVLGLRHREALGREDFLVTEANRSAVAMIDLWPNWPGYGMIICGPSGSGKTHLAEVWRKMSGAEMVAAADIGTDKLPDLQRTRALAIEDVSQPGVDDTAIFHLLNLARNSGAHLLLTGEGPPARWPVRLPDLVSRLRALPLAELGPPDDALLRGVMVKLFADRQLAVDEAVVSYLLLRMPRSLAAARALVNEIDLRALEQKQEITRNFVSRILGNFNAPGFLETED
jgi:chromosomal replication initiation ATPase DnaA